MSNNEFSVSISIPDKLRQALEKYQQENRIESTSDAILDILRKFFEMKATAPTYASIKQVEALENWVKDLAEQIASINQSVKYLSLTRSIATSTVPLDSVDPEDDIEDEPDEILFDFLPEADR
jgi:metal-responsive CopG/Arc/MetJ family transcriptional regulator